jgi:uncharacterized membrane protein YvlD (DUF360 family)
MPGVNIDTLGAMLLAAAALGVMNGIIRPLLFVSGKMFNHFILTGLTFFVNAFGVFILKEILPGITIPAFWELVSLAGLFSLTLCSIVLTRSIKDK